MRLAIHAEFTSTIPNIIRSQRVEKLIQNLQEESDTKRMVVALLTAAFAYKLLTRADISTANETAIATGLSGSLNTADLLHHCSGSASRYLGTLCTYQR